MCGVVLLFVMLRMFGFWMFNVILCLIVNEE